MHAVRRKNWQFKRQNRVKLVHLQRNKPVTTFLKHIVNPKDYMFNNAKFCYGILR